MEQRDQQRRLTTILAADVVGYSRLMGADEAGTLAALKAHRRKLIEPKTVQYNGRTVKLMGDGALLEFGSVVDAVRFAVEVQAAMPERNADVPDDRRIQYRVGLNIGDIIVDGDDIYGDGVNIAARLEGLAEPGGICIARNVFDQVKDKLGLTFEPLGEQRVKNIAEPVEVYRLPIDDAAIKLRTPVDEPAPKRRWHWAAAAAVVVIALGATGGLWTWDNWWRFQRVEAASLERMAYPLPDKPSVAVLPFDNLTGDVGQDFMIDGLVEEIITTLSKIPDMFVISRNSTFTYKGRPVNVSQVAEELGVRYVLEGSVRQSGNSVRITAQLIDAVAGHHMWAETYDRKLENVLALQSEIALTIATELDVTLMVGEAGRVDRGTTTNAQAFEMFQRVARGGGSNPASRAELASLRQGLREAIELDPNFAAAWSELGDTYRYEVRVGWAESRSEGLAEAESFTRTAIAIDPDYAPAYSNLARIHIIRREWDLAVEAAEQAVAIAPNDPYALFSLGNVLNKVGRSDEAIPLIRTAMRLEPYYSYRYLNSLGQSLYRMGRYEEAIDVYKELVQRRPNNYGPYYRLALVYSLAGRMDEARDFVAKAHEIRPSYTLRVHAEVTNLQDPGELQLELDALRAAGMLEGD